MSFIQDDEKKSSNLWDIIIFVVLVLGGLGFWYYYRSQRTVSNHGFEHADSLYQAKKYPEAIIAYEALKGADYIESKQDSIIFVRLDELYTWQENHQAKPVDTSTQVDKPDTLSPK